MSGSLNKIQIIGNVCKDGETRVFQNGNKVHNLTVATNETWKNKDGERQERTEFHRVAIFQEGLVRIAEQYLKKGSKVYIEGKNQTRKYQAQDGSDRYSTEIVLQGFDGKLVMLDGREQSQGGYDNQRQDNNQQHSQAPAGYGGGGSAMTGDDEIPFAPEWRV